MIKIKKLKILFLFFIFYFLFSESVFAAEIFLSTKSQEVKVNQLFEVGVFINTNEESINAIEGKIIFPQDFLKLKKINDGNSVINFWVEKPKIKSGQIFFSGIIPGGYSGKKGFILSLVFQSTEQGQGLIKTCDIKALLNDGKGTKTKVITSNLQFVISEQALSPKIFLPEKKDINKPEIFKPMVASNSTMFDGKYFLVFATQDKGSGIDHYEVKEGLGSFETVSSPYVLANQNLDVILKVKAVDKNGNQRIVEILAKNSKKWYENYWFRGIIIVIASLILWGLIIFVIKIFNPFK